MNNLKTYLTEAYAIDNKSILRILTQNKQINMSDPDYGYYEKLANWANEKGRQQKLKNIDLNTINLSDRGLIEKRKLITRYTTLGHLLLALKNLMDQEGKYTPSSELSRLVQQTTLEILANLSGIPNTKAPQEEPGDDEEEPIDEEEPVDNDPTDGEELRKGRDWTAYKAKKLANAKNPANALDEFYNEYYSVEYAGVDSPEKDSKGIVAKLKSLDKILIPEFNKLGYNPEVNPFASFLKILIDKNSNIFKKLTFNTYGAIHNSFIAEHITGNELGQKFTETNILFCEDLYNKNGLDIIEYLDLQKQTHNAQKNSEYANDVNLVSKIFIQQNQEDPAADYSSKVNKLLDPKLQGVIHPGSDKARLRSIPEIRELYRYIFKDEATRTKRKVSLKTVKEIVDAAEKQNVVLDMIKLILAQNEYVGSTKYAEEAQKIESWLDTQNHTYTKQGIVDSRKILLNYVLNAEALSLIINNLKNHVEESSENTN